MTKSLKVENISIVVILVVAIVVMASWGTPAAGPPPVKADARASVTADRTTIINKNNLGMESWNKIPDRLP